MKLNPGHLVYNITRPTEIISYSQYLNHNFLHKYCTCFQKIIDVTSRCDDGGHLIPPCRYANYQNIKSHSFEFVHNMHTIGI